MVVAPPASFLVGALPILLAFFLGCIRFAVDLVDLVAAELVADVAAPIAVALGFWLGTTRQYLGGRGAAAGGRGGAGAAASAAHPVGAATATDGVVVAP